MRCGPRRSACAEPVLGICGFCVLPLVGSIAALVLGRQAQAEVRASDGRLGGLGQADAGVVLGWVGVGLSALAIVAFTAIWLLTLFVIGQADDTLRELGTTMTTATP